MLIVHLFVSYAHVNLCHFFSSSWCRGLAAASASGSSWTFLFTFSTYFIAITKHKLLFQSWGFFHLRKSDFTVHSPERLALAMLKHEVEVMASSLAGDDIY